jgi:hypothetical protein
MNMKRLFFPLLATSAVVGIGLGGLLEHSNKSRLDAAFADTPETRQLREQPTKERQWRKVAYRREWTLTNTPAAPLYGPLTGRAGDDGSFYLLDSGDLAVKKVDAAGKLVQSYGEGKGQGPGEFASLTDFAVAPGGEVWAADASNGRLSVFSPDGRVARTVRLESPPYRLALEPKGFDVLYMLSKPVLFGRYGADDALRGSFGTFLKDQGVNAMLLDGWVAAIPGGGFVYVARYVGLLAAYDGEGRQRFLVGTLQRPPLPKIVQGSQGRMWVDREAPWAAAGLSVTRDGIHVLGFFQSGLKKIGSIDTYDLRDGSYLHSRSVPESCNSVVVTDRAVYTIKDVTVTRWALPS